METSPDHVYLGVDNRPADMGEVLRFLAEEMGLPQPPSEAPGPAASEADGAAIQVSRGGNKRCSNARLRSTGFEFTFPSYREGYRAILAGQGVRHR